MNELTEKLRDALDEDEQWALAASAPYHGGGPTVPGGMHWVWAIGDHWEHYKPDPLEEHLAESAQESIWLITCERWPYSWDLPDRPGAGRVLSHVDEVRTADAAHIVRHDPARVLRQVAAMRKVLELHSPVEVVAFGKVTARECAACFDVDTYRGYSEDPPRLDWPCPTILALAEAYGIEVEG